MGSKDPNLPPLAFSAARTWGMSLAPLKLWKNNLVHYIYFCLKQGLMLPRQASNFNSVVKHLPAMLEGLGCSHIIGGKKNQKKSFVLSFYYLWNFLICKIFYCKLASIKKRKQILTWTSRIWTITQQFPVLTEVL